MFPFARIAEELLPGGEWLDSAGRTKEEGFVCRGPPGLPRRRRTPESMALPTPHDSAVRH
ncbi:hypothetical protein SGFS_033770 [Streptomyces graminofaciens]|uniref:Uncharacterized protein n=1 Tax=Streptomyces graminofaciens TaxID=68212 RepID=A0ABN5VID8_9ACTN|nr:hypothetical protein SGFS_033770 [Streptomyces graminofaciens]